MIKQLCLTAILLFSLQGDGMQKLNDDTFCLYDMGNGTFQCTSCSSPPEGFVSQQDAPAGLSEGTYTAEELRNYNVEPIRDGGE